MASRRSSIASMAAIRLPKLGVPVPGERVGRGNQNSMLRNYALNITFHDPLCFCRSLPVFLCLTLSMLICISLAHFVNLILTISLRLLDIPRPVVASQPGAALKPHWQLQPSSVQRLAPYVTSLNAAPRVSANACVCGKEDGGHVCDRVLVRKGKFAIENAQGRQETRPLINNACDHNAQWLWDWFQAPPTARLWACSLDASTHSHPHSLIHSNTWYSSGLAKPSAGRPRLARCALISATSPAIVGAAALVPSTEPTAPPFSM
jgi:hypothetical protein